MSVAEGCPECRAMHMKVGQATAKLLDEQMATRTLRVLVAWQAGVISQRRAANMLHLPEPEVQERLERLLVSLLEQQPA